MPYGDEENCPTKIRLLAVIGALGFPLFFIGGSILQMSDHPGFYSIPLTDLPSYRYAYILYGLCFGIGLLITYALVRSATVEIPVLAMGGIMAAISCFAMAIIPKMIQYFDEQRAFYGPTTRETHILRVDGSSYLVGKHSTLYEALINPYNISNQSSGVRVDRDAYRAITTPDAVYCLSLTIEHAGSNQRLVEPLGEFRVADLQACPPGAI